MELLFQGVLFCRSHALVRRQGPEVVGIVGAAQGDGAQVIELPRELRSTSSISLEGLVPLASHGWVRSATRNTVAGNSAAINLPLTVREIEAVVFFRQTEGNEYCVSMRSKSEIDIGAVAMQFGGGGHQNAADG